jgi:hypothetical protein
MNVFAFALPGAAYGDAIRTTSSSNRSAGFSGALAAAARTAQGAAAASTSTVRSPFLAARLVLPTREAVEALATGVKDELAARLSAAGIAANPPITLSVDGDGAIRAAGDRTDTAAIEAAIAKDDGLVRDIRTATAIASHAYALESGGHLQFQRAYRLSADPKEVVAQYAGLSGSTNASAMSLRFSGAGLAVDADGTGWIGVL